MKLKYLTIGLIAGVLLATAGSSFAASVIEKVTASVRTDFSIELDGKQLELKNPPLAYDGNSYLPVRELATILGKDVDFQDGVIKLDTPEEDGNVNELNLDNWKSIAQLKLDGHDVRIGVGLVPGDTAKSNRRWATVTYYSGSSSKEIARFIIDSVLSQTKEFVNDDGARLLFYDGDFYLEIDLINEFI